MPFRWVLSSALAWKRSPRRSVWGRRAGPMSQAAGCCRSQASMLAAALQAQGTCSQGLASVSAPPGSWGNSDMVRDSKSGYMYILLPLSLACQNERHCKWKSSLSLDQKMASLIVCLILLRAVYERVIPHKFSSTSLMIDTWVEVSSQKINLCIGGTVPWTAQPQDILLQSRHLAQANSFPREGSSLQEKVFANALPSGTYLWVLCQGPSAASSSLPTAVLVWCLVDSARACSCAHLLLVVICLSPARYNDCVSRDDDYAISIPTVLELSCY